MRPASRARLRKLGFLWAGEPQELTQGAVDGQSQAHRGPRITSGLPVAPPPRGQRASQGSCRQVADPGVLMAQVLAYSSSPE